MQETKTDYKQSGKINNALIILLVVVLVIFFVALAFTYNGDEKQTAGISEKEAAEILEKSVTTTPASSIVTETGVTFSEFNVKIENGKFIPEEVVINKGGMATFNLTPVDGDYDFMFYDPKIGFYFDLKKGNTETFGIPTAEKEIGVYEFGCKDKCGSYDSIRGRLVIK